MLSGHLSAVNMRNAERVTAVHAEAITQSPSPFQVQLCSASARGTAARRRRYGSLKLEDMGIRSASETPVIVTSNISGITLDKGGKVLSSPTAQSSIVQSIPTSCSLMQTSSSLSSSDLNDSFGTEMRDCTSKSEDAINPSGTVGPSFLAGNQTSVCQKLSLPSDSCMANNYVSLPSERSKTDLLPVKKAESPDSRTDLKLPVNSQHASYFRCSLNGHSNFSSEHFQAIHFGAVNSDKISCQTADYIGHVFSITDSNIQNDVCQNIVNVSKHKGLCSTTVETGIFKDVADDSMAAIDDMKSKRTFKKSGHLVQDTMQNVAVFSNFSSAVPDSTDSKPFAGIELTETDLIENLRSRPSFSAASKPRSVFEKDHNSCVFGNECMGDISKTDIGIEHMSTLDSYFPNTDSVDISLPQHKLRKFLDVDDLSVNIDEGDEFEMKEECAGSGECRWIHILHQQFDLPGVFCRETINDCKVAFSESSCNVSLSSVLQKNCNKCPLSSTVKPTVSLSSLSLHRRQSSLLSRYPGTVGLMKQSGVVGALYSSVKHSLEDSVSSDRMQLSLSVPETALGEDVVSASHKGDYIVLVLYPLFLFIFTLCPVSYVRCLGVLSIYE